MKIDFSLLKGRGGALTETLKKRWPLFAALLLGLLLLILPRGEQNAGDAGGLSPPAFSLEAEEEKLTQALEKLEGVGRVTVVLSLKSSMEQRVARDDSSHYKSLSEGYELQSESEAVRIQTGSGVQQPVTLQFLYPEYRGALILAERLTPALRLEITQAVAALTGLATDKITVTAGK